MPIGAAGAATATTTFTVTANVTKVCTVAALPLSFGSYDPTSATPLDATTTVTLNCTVGTAYNVGLNAGTGTGATVAARKMTSGADTLTYSLYRDAGRTTIWGNTVGTDTTSGTFAIGQAALTVFGRVPAGQNVTAATYTDTITVTVTY
jgi:spore coat protein U-like protein